MRQRSYLFQGLGLGLFLMAAGCGSSKATEGGGTGGGGYTVGGNGSNPANGFPAAQNYTDPATGKSDGLMPVDSTTASNLKNADTVCQGWQAEPEGNGAAIMEFVIDITSSMSIDRVVANDNSTPTKWAVFQPTMETVFQNLPGSFAIGAMYFAAQTNQCYAPNSHDVPIALDTATQSQALVNSVATVQPNGATPTYQAWEHALGLVTSYTPGPNDPPGMQDAARYIVLVTDGVPTVGRQDVAPNCQYLQNGISQNEYDQELAAIDADTQRTGVKTFVVGVSGSNNPQNAVFDPLYYLSKLAVIGQTAPAGCVPSSGTVLANDVQPRGNYCHIDLSNAGTDLAAQLSSALTGIANSVLPCTYSVPAPPAGKTIDPNQTILVFTDGGTGATSVVLENTSGTCDKGWHFANATSTQIEVCGATCDAIQANSRSTLNLVFGCNAAQIIN